METTVCCQGADSEQVRRRWRQRYLRRKAMRLFIWCPWQEPIQECGKDNNLIGVDLWKERSEEVEKLKEREWEKREREQERAIVNTFSLELYYKWGQGNRVVAKGKLNWREWLERQEELLIHAVITSLLFHQSHLCRSLRAGLWRGALVLSPSIPQGGLRVGYRYRFLFFFFFNFFFKFVVNFVIHWNETALSLHVFPIPIPPPTSLSTRWSPLYRVK